MTNRYKVKLVRGNEAIERRVSTFEGEQSVRDLCERELPGWEIETIEPIG